MGEIVVTNASAVCSFGTGPGPIKPTSQSVCIVDKKPAATIQDVQAIVNVGPFGMCTSMANPQVAAATAVALGVLTPQPCIPMAAGMWIPTKPSILMNGKPCLTSDCKMMCSNGAGVISIVNPGQAKINVK